MIYGLPPSGELILSFSSSQTWPKGETSNTELCKGATTCGGSACFGCCSVSRCLAEKGNRVSNFN